MSRTSRFAFSSVLALALVACSTPPSPADPTADLAAIKTLRSTFESTFNGGDAAKIAALYTANAVSMQEHQPPTVGHDAIQAMYTQLNSMGSWNITLLAEETKVMGDMAYDRGTFMTMMTPRNGGAQTMENGKYLVLLQKGADGAWKVAREIGNSSDPLPPPPAVAAKPAARKK